ncbi:unnamed protein product [Mycena citricolor]|uniref:Uncharacterized protein n=1 Tax=Mycena citricolor TaxID=2018698 RepID=A0AAD2HZ23_9AGAR|nr:unnamed protein product [Mycena citricolor]
MIYALIFPLSTATHAFLEVPHGFQAQVTALSLYLILSKRLSLTLFMKCINSIPQSCSSCPQSGRSTNRGLCSHDRLQSSVM